MTFTRSTRPEIARRAARDIPRGSYVNLGIGLPTEALAVWQNDADIFVHSENGILGMRMRSESEPEDPDLINASKLPVAMRAGGSFFNHADSFAMMRGGHLDYCLLGAYEVSAHGDIANWSLGIPNVAAAVGGAMDLAAGVKAVWVVMQHCSRSGSPRLVEQCTLPLTAAGVVRRIYTDLATLVVADGCFEVIDIAEGMTFDDLADKTAAPVRWADAAQGSGTFTTAATTTKEMP